MHCTSGMELTHREKDGIQILDLRGQLKGGNSESTLRSAINSLPGDNVPNVTLNLAEVTKIDIDGLEALVSCQAQVRKRGGALKLARLNFEHVTPNLRTELKTVFEVFVDEQDAVNSFFPARAIRHYDVLEWLREQEGDAVMLRSGSLQTSSSED
jgi:anti-sigma B factor antagonist